MFLRYSLFRLQKNFRKRGYHENIIVRRYGKRYFKNHSIYDDFLDIFGLALTDEYTISTFQPEEARAFMEKYRAGNRKIMEKYFHKSEDLFKINFENIKKWEWNSQHMSEDIIRLLGHTTITIRKENEELRQRIIHLEQASQTQSKTISDLKEKLKHPAKTILSKVLK